MRPSFNFVSDISPARLTSFSDGVFAIAITLLVFNLKVPVIVVTDAHRLLPGKVMAMVPQFATYALSFLLIAIYWTIHHHMLNMVTHVDNRFIWINMFYLLTVSFVPFPSALFGAYPQEAFSLLFYFCSMVLVGLISMLLWWYASQNHRLIKADIPPEIVNFFFARGFSSMVVFLVAIVLTLYNTSWGQGFPLAIFPVLFFVRAHYKKKLAKAAKKP